MLRTMRITLLASAVLLLTIAFVYHPAKAGRQAGTSRGVTLIQLSCGQDTNGPVVGPATIGVSTGGCDNVEAAGGFRLPSGTLYNMRAIVGAGTTDPTPATLKVMVYTSASRIPILVCESATGTSGCKDLIHSGTVNAGDIISASVTIPDSNTWLTQTTITVEENIIE